MQGIIEYLFIHPIVIKFLPKEKHWRKGKRARIILNPNPQGYMAMTWSIQIM
jgi:hypothetical protein